MFVVQIMTMLTGIIGSLVDGMITGNFLGQDAMAAFGFTSSVSLAAAIIGSIISTGASVVCSKCLGEGKLEDTRRGFSVCFTTALIVSLVFAALTITFATPIAKLMGARGDLVFLASDYIRGYGLACPGIVLVAFLMPMMQMDGDMNRLLVSVVIMTIANIAADLMNVLLFHAGMFGMALATAISYYLALLYLTLHFFKKEVVFSRPSLILDGSIIRAMIASGFPTATSQLGRLLLTFFLNHYLMANWGGTAVAAHTIIMSAAGLCMVPGTALGSSVQVISGILYGEEDCTGLKRLMGAAMRYNIIVNGACTLAFLLLSGPLIRMFYSGDSAALTTTIVGFRLYALCLIFYGTNLIFRSYCQSTYQVKKSYLITVFDCFLAPFLMSLLFGAVFGIPAIWLCYVLGEGLTMIVMLMIFRLGNRKAPGLGSFIPNPPMLGEDIEAMLEYSISESSDEQACAISKEVAAFCSQHGANERQIFLTSLAVEEAVGNVMEHGFNDGKPHHIDMRILKKNDRWILRIRDDCPQFNPNKYIEQFDNDDNDPASNIGLKLIRSIAVEMVYVNALKLNNLMIRI